TQESSRATIMRMNFRAFRHALAIVVALTIASAALAENSDRVSIIPVPDHGRPVAAKMDAEGTIHLLYDSPDGPQYVKSTDHGKSFSPAISVADRESRKPGLEFHGSDMVVGKGNRVHVAMFTNAWKLKLPEEEWGFFYGSLDPGAKAFSPVR